MKIDLNVDIGEGFPHDEELLRYATSASICCGEHAGSWDVTLEAVERCRLAGVRVGAHPGYPDRPSMGRAPAKAEEMVQYSSSLHAQIGRMAEVAGWAYLKPHGAFYNESCRPGPVFDILVELLRESGRPLMGLPNTAHDRTGAPLIREGFADRATLPDGRLMPRSCPGSVLTDPEAVKAQVLGLVGKVDSICLHGDTPDCVEFARLVRRTLEAAGFEVGV